MKAMMIAALLSLTAISLAASAQSHGEVMAYCTGSSVGGFNSGTCYDLCTTFGIC